MTTLDLELTLSNLLHELERDGRSPAGGMLDAGRVLAGCERHRRLACGLLLADLDVEGFRGHLVHGAEAYLGLLLARERGREMDPYALCASRALPLLDALAAGRGDVAREIAARMTPGWTRRMEPRVDFLFFHALARATRGEDTGPVLREAAGAGLFSTRLEVLEALEAGDVRALESALEARVDDWHGELEGQRQRDALPPEAANTEARVCLEVVALLHFAHARGLRPEAPTRYVPAEVVAPVEREGAR